MINVVKQCGNGGDWEWLRDQHYWIMWITANITDHFSTGVDYTTPADKLVIRFSNDHDATAFMLIAPNYITYNDVKEYDI